MNNKIMFLFVVVVLFVGIISGSASGQTIGPSDQSSAVQLVYSRADAEKKCGPMPQIDMRGVPYAPINQSTVKSYERFETYGLALMCMQTSLPQYRSNNGIGWVLTPDKSQVGFTRHSMAYYLGTADGQFKRCHNTIYAIAVAVHQEESWTPTEKPQPQINVSANANATAIAKAEVCKPGPWKYDRTDTIEGKDFEVYSNGCTESLREIVAEKKVELCPEGKLRDERTGQCIEPSKGDSWWTRIALIGAGYAAGDILCRSNVTCRVKKNIPVPTIPTKGPGPSGNPPGIPPGTRGRTTGTGTVGSRNQTSLFSGSNSGYQSGPRNNPATSRVREYSTNTSGCANLIRANGKIVCAIR